jgi:RNA polymerase sigma-70 factor (sigma-E family)
MSVENGTGATTDDEAAAFHEFFEQHYAELARLAHLLTGEADAADDLAADALVALWRHWDRVRGADHPAAYARGVVANLARSRIRSAVRERRRVALFWSQRTDRVAEQPDVPAVLDLREALQRLPFRKRACVVLRHAFDLSERDTAEALGISVGTVKSQTSRGVAELERLLAQPADTPTAAPATVTAADGGTGAGAATGAAVGVTAGATAATGPATGPSTAVGTATRVAAAAAMEVAAGATAATVAAPRAGTPAVMGPATSAAADAGADRVAMCGSVPDFLTGTAGSWSARGTGHGARPVPAPTHIPAPPLAALAHAHAHAPMPVPAAALGERLVAGRTASDPDGVLEAVGTVSGGSLGAQPPPASGTFGAAEGSAAGAAADTTPGATLLVEQPASQVGELAPFGGRSELPAGGRQGPKGSSAAASGSAPAAGAGAEQSEAARIPGSTDPATFPRTRTGRGL